MPSVFAQLARFWYFIGAPAPVPETAPFKQRELVRRCRVASWILLIILFMDLLPIPGVLGKPSIIMTLLVVFGIDLGALLFNRGGHIRVAGILAIITTEAGLLGTFLTVPGGAGAVDLPLLDLLLQATVVAAAFLSPAGSLILTMLNGGIIYLVLQTPTLSPELAHLYQGRGFSILLQAWEIQFAIGVFLFIITRSANLALRQSDRAEEIAKLQRQEIERQEEHVQREKVLNTSIEQVLTALQNFNNGNWNSKVPIERDNILFRVGYAINNLLNRVASARQAEQRYSELEQRYRELQLWVQQYQSQTSSQILQGDHDRTNQAAQALIEHLWGGKLPTQKSGTVIDSVVEALRTTPKQRATWTSTLNSTANSNSQSILQRPPTEPFRR